MISKIACVWICVLFSLFLHVSGEHVFPDTGDYTEQVDVNEGDDISIPCNTTKSLDIELYWTKNATGSGFHRDGLFLNFTNINRVEHGEYICNSFNNKTQVLEKIQTVRVNVLYKAGVNSVRINPQVLAENETYTVICDFEGNPSPKWFIRNNYTKELLDSEHGSGIFVTSFTAKCGDTGPIVCSAQNILNKDKAYMSENITVLCSPRPDAINQFWNTAYVGQRSFLVMNVMGYPFPNYTWSRDDGQPLGDVTQINLPYLAYLTFKNVSVGDFGNYTLTLENAYGCYTAQYQLIPWGPPEMPYSLNYSDVTCNSVRLYWTSGFDMGSQQKFVILRMLGGNTYTNISNVYDNSSTHGIGQNWTILLTNLESDSYITLTVQSFNKFYRSNYVTPGVTFHTLPDPDSASYLSRHKTDIIIGVTIGSVAIAACITGSIAFITYKRKRNPYTDFK